MSGLSSEVLSGGVGLGSTGASTVAWAEASPGKGRDAAAVAVGADVGCVGDATPPHAAAVRANAPSEINLLRLKRLTTT